MADLLVSAPGKVILFGDHSVVYGKKAIAASISLRTSLEFTRHGTKNLVLDLADVGLHLDLQQEEIQQMQLPKTIHEIPQMTDISPESQEMLKTKIDSCLAARGMQDTQHAAASAFLTLYFSIGSPDGLSDVGCYRIKSDLPIGAGLGSSASVCVVISATLLILRDLIERPHSTRDSHWKEVLELINQWAYVGEQCLHGRPSGVDNTVATYGGGVAFQKNAPIELLTMPALPLLLTDTKVERSTKNQVSQVAQLKSTMPHVVDPVLVEMHEVAVQAHFLLRSHDMDLERIGQLISRNQELLRAIGVSHPSIERVIQHNSENGWTKLVGAGGGGCVVTLLRASSKSDTPTKTSNKELDMDEYRIQLGGPGVGVHLGDGSIIYY